MPLASSELGLAAAAGRHQRVIASIEESARRPSRTTFDGFGAATGDWTGYWGRQGPELLDLELIERRTLDGHIQDLTDRPTLHRGVRP